MKGLLLIAASVFFFTSSVCFAQGKGSTESVTAPAGGIPQITQVIGTTKVEFGPTKFPIFQAAKGDNPECAAQLEKLNPNGKPNPDGKYDGYSLAFLPPKLNSVSEQYKYVVIPDLVIENFEIGETFKKTTKLLITWTIRVEGEQPKAKDPKCIGDNNIGYRIFPCLCNFWHGSTVQVFKGGAVSSRLYVNDEWKGNVASMTMPDAGEATVIQINDPTITGSCLLSKDDFGGEFPSVIKKIEVRWYNDTSMNVWTAKNTHNLIIKMIPVTSSD